MSENQKLIEEIAENPAMLKVGRKAIEDALIQWRDNRLSELMRGNGFVIREADGQASHVIRFGPETGLRIALKAIAAALASPSSSAGEGGKVP